MRDKSSRLSVLAKIFRYIYLRVPAHLSDRILSFLKVADRAWIVLRQEGAIIEEADDDDAGDGTEDIFDEKDALAEKFGLHLQDIGSKFGATEDGGI